MIYPSTIFMTATAYSLPGLCCVFVSLCNFGNIQGPKREGPEKKEKKKKKKARACNIPGYLTSPPNMPRVISIRQLRRTGLSEPKVLGILESIDMLLVGEAEAMEGEGLWVILGALHEAPDGRASPLARVHRGPIGERKGLQRRATRAHCEVFASVVEETLNVKAEEDITHWTRRASDALTP